MNHTPRSWIAAVGLWAVCGLPSPGIAQEPSPGIDAGRAALARGDLAAADRLLADFLVISPAQAPQVGRAWRDAALDALAQGRTDRALALFSKAVAADASLAPEAGSRLLQAAHSLPAEAERARVATRAVAWAGADAVADATVRYMERTLGPARRVDLDLPGWLDLAKAQPGDELVYVAAHPFRQRDAGAMRLMPAAVEAPLRYTFTPDDMGGAPETLVRLARDREPAKVFLWLIPWSAAAPR